MRFAAQGITVYPEVNKVTGVKCNSTKYFPINLSVFTCLLENLFLQLSQAAHKIVATEKMQYIFSENKNLPPQC